MQVSAQFVPLSICAHICHHLQAETLGLLQVVQETARSSHHNMRLLAKCDSLLHHIQTTEDQGTPERDQGAKCFEGLGDLRRKFSCGCQDQREQRLRLVEKRLENWEGKCRSLAATGFGNANYVAVLKREGNGLLLDGRGPLVPEPVAGVAERVDDALTEL